ncbi:hypothetical protein TOT_040000675 [Theileria orientalis strain Shintoku]|uniref:Uncharacterized protein n=1 Tax=Theileria orientalis strain Shintoku TaxID=869250 RepID=J7MGV5_THEOR|nr:hypothetical protein TOT_040000675 [Theileria orientalis strain Shintoku]BAM42306.1 hypothetical protein TOT_040000675 [Theileria orientalis strain Shintoku]|eukprot:XP_009692607.1 hypothetical protein TOT_040000675 [Theileria orientalis strain Shintoku]
MRKTSARNKEDMKIICSTHIASNRKKIAKKEMKKLLSFGESTGSKKKKGEKEKGKEDGLKRWEVILEFVAVYSMNIVPISMAVFSIVFSLVTIMLIMNVSGVKPFGGSFGYHQAVLFISVLATLSTAVTLRYQT